MRSRTIRRFEVVNLFAFRATDPDELHRAGFQVGPDNARHIRDAVTRAVVSGGKVVCAWGAHARGRAEAWHCLRGLAESGVTAYALRLLHDGTPAHPLMLPYSCKLREINA
jgi:hypothetical protein